MAFWSPLDPRKMVIKRVVGLEGDVVRLRGTSEPVHVPPGHVWVEGDDGLHSRDSNLYGPVSGNVEMGMGMECGLMRNLGGRGNRFR